jgi:hypothetical protein
MPCYAISRYNFKSKSISRVRKKNSSLSIYTYVLSISRDAECYTEIYRDIPSYLILRCPWYILVYLLGQKIYRDVLGISMEHRSISTVFDRISYAQRGISRYILGTSRYILVYANLIFCFCPCCILHPAGPPPECCAFAARFNASR